MKQRIETGKCVICSINIQQPGKHLARHIGRHLREFSLASLPPLEEDDGGEERGKGDVVNDDKRLDSGVESQASSEGGVGF